MNAASCNPVAPYELRISRARVFDSDGSTGTAPAFQWRSQLMMGITKRGSQHLRTAVVHDARAVARTAVRKTDSRNLWVNELRRWRAYKRATLAAARKNARVILAVPISGEPYRATA